MAEVLFCHCPRSANIQFSSILSRRPLKPQSIQISHILTQKMFIDRGLRTSSAGITTSPRPLHTHTHKSIQFTFLNVFLQSWENTYTDKIRTSKHLSDSVPLLWVRYYRFRSQFGFELQSWTFESRQNQLTLQGTCNDEHTGDVSDMQSRRPSHENAFLLLCPFCFGTSHFVGRFRRLSVYLISQLNDFQWHWNGRCLPEQLLLWANDNKISKGFHTLAVRSQREIIVVWGKHFCVSKRLFWYFVSSWNFTESGSWLTQLESGSCGMAARRAARPGDGPSSVRCSFIKLFRRFSMPTPLRRYKIDVHSYACLFGLK